VKKAGLFLSVFLLLWGGKCLADRPDILAFSSELGLSAEQTQRVEEIRLKSERKAIKLKADLKLAQLDLRSLLQKDYPDKGAVYKKVEEIGALRTRLEKNRIDTRLEVHNLLSPEQRKKLREAARELIKERRHRKLMERRFPPCWPPPPK